MNMNYYSIESQMLQRKSEIEKAAVTAWQISHERKHRQMLKDAISGLKALTNSTRKQTQTACCSCC
ncbi:hypothetical protein LJR153_003603 [Paenibacillus sp. LjRoot153]|uniref:hypothetical protein n=1 Tax=Paenibacillus sp. LjRoot153 TaxID=3342270 RepID=UPI003ED02DED